MLEALQVIWACGLDLAAHLVETRSTVLPVLQCTLEHGPPGEHRAPGGSTVLPGGSTGKEHEHGAPYRLVS